jgi:hypothetical protein
MDGNNFERSDLLQAFMTAGSEDGSGKFSVTVDEEKYQAFLDDPSLSDEQKDQIVQALWPIIVTFVEIHFGSHPVQQACGQLTKNLETDGQTDSDRGSSDIVDHNDKIEDAPDQP